MHDLRDWLKQTEEIGALKRIRGMSWDQEIGCITQLNKGKNAPALIFEDIKGYPNAYQVLSSALKTPQRLAAALCLPLANSDKELLSVLVSKLTE